MKKYYVDYWRDFANTYNVYYTDETMDGFEVPDEWERITRKEAERLVRRERWRREYDTSSSGYASAWIYPADLEEYELNLHASRFEWDGLFVERVGC